MIRFKILGGDFLELPSDFKFQFSYNNSLFAFEKMQLSRSTEFQVPATPHNNKLLEFANDPAADGSYVRRRKMAELYYSGGKIDGFLFFGKFDKGSYSAIFVYGELTKIKLLNELGNIANYTNFTATLSTAPPAFDSAYESSGILPYSFAWYKYKNGKDTPLVGAMNYSPSVKLRTLVNQAALKANVNTSIDSSELYNSIALILPTQRRQINGVSISFSGIPKSTLSVTGASSYLQPIDKTFKYKPFVSIFWKKQTVKCFEATQDLTLRITSASPYTMMVGGDGRTIIGEGLASKIGTEVSFKKGEYFTIVSRLDYFMDSPTEEFKTAVSVTCAIWGVSEDEISIGDVYPLQENLPEVTLVDLLKTFAAITKRGIDYDVETNTISFFDFNFNKSNGINLDDKVVELVSVDRTFLDYARRNVVNYKSEAYVKSREQITYRIDNDIIPDEKILFTIPFSEGNFDEDNNVLVEDFDEENKKVSKVPTIGIVSKISGEDYLKHVSEFYINIDVGRNLYNIINKSTTVVLTVKMSAGEFLKIKNKDTFKYRSQYYICIDGTHSTNVATLTLIKI